MSRISHSIIALTLFLVVSGAHGATVAYNVDFGTLFGLPATTFGAAANTPGEWNQVVAGAVNQNITSADGFDSVSLTVSAGSNGSTGTADTDAKKLLFDNFFLSAWSVSISGLDNQDYLVYLYAPSNTVVSTGDMDVNGVSVTGIAGSAGGELIAGTSYTVATATVTNGILDISTADIGNRGLAGLQIVSTAIPIPPAIWLFASGLGLLGWTQRKRG